MRPLIVSEAIGQEKREGKAMMEIYTPMWRNYGAEMGKTSSGPRDFCQQRVKCSEGRKDRVFCKQGVSRISERKHGEDNKDKYI